MRTGRVLVVDDEVSARTALADLLRDEGYDVETAADAFKAIGKLDAFRPQVVVTDLQMPGMDGIELVKKINGAMPIVVMTAFGAVHSAVEALHAGAADYLMKPFDFGVLLVVLDRVFGGEDRPVPAVQQAPSGMPRVPGATMDEIERYVILETLKATGGSTSKAAEMLGISTRTVQYRLHQYNEAARSDVPVVKKPTD